MKYILTTFLLLLSLYTQGQVENIITDESEISYDSSDSTWVIVRTKVTSIKLSELPDSILLYNPIIDSNAIRNIYSTGYNDLVSKVQLYRNALDSRDVVEAAIVFDNYMRRLTQTGYFERICEQYQSYYVGNWRIKMGSNSIDVTLIRNPNDDTSFIVNQVNSENKWILRPIVGKDLFIIPNFLGENRYLLNTRGLSKTPANTFVSLDAIYPIGIEPTLLIMTKLSN
jgi:hypothetical protein